MANRDARLPFTVLLPDTRLQQIEIHDHLTSLRMVLVEKDAVDLLGPSWDRPGVYVLLDGVAEDSTFAVYVGKAPVGIRSRLLDHERKKQRARALLMQRDNQHGLNSAHIGWLRVEIEAEAPDGFTEFQVRTVSENSNALKSDQAGFEEDH